MENSNSSITWIIIVITFVVFIGGIVILSDSDENLSEDETREIIDNGFGHYKGNKDASIVIVEYSDFQCPACATFPSTLNKLIKNYGNDIKVVYNHFPLKSIHQNAQLAAEAAEAAGEQGKFWEMHDVLFAKQKEWGPLSNDDFMKKLIVYAQDIKVDDLEQFKYSLDNSSFKDRIDRDIDDANKLGVNSTPTVYLNGGEISDRSYSNMESKIQRLLNK